MPSGEKFMIYVIATSFIKTDIWIKPTLKITEADVSMTKYFKDQLERNKLDSTS